MTQKCFQNLEKYTDKKIWDDIMYMGCIGNINLYKHCDTRHYINIDNEGKFYKYNGTGYDEISKEQAMNYLLS